ncbi:MAG: hypothetical protein HRT89_04915 [Lentisphaeria bacterium]|nr:hypothetical protein [Lentisphaeria bacterium]NQZ67390.1 hypothetical protein [Lentisphaeria bacterium]
MAFYDYHCDENGQTIEVQHPISDKLANWQELCECAGIQLGETSGDVPVKRLLNGGVIAGTKSQTGYTPAMSRKDAGHSCGPGCGH